jgi:hypothetical protein
MVGFRKIINKLIITIEQKEIYYAILKNIVKKEFIELLIIELSLENKKKIITFK